MSSSLWPDLAGLAPPRGMSEMLYDLAGDIGTRYDGALDFHVDLVGVGGGGVVRHVRFNCYLRVVKKGYLHLLFQVQAPVGGPFPARAATPEGEEYPDLKTEGVLRHAVGEILRRERTKEVVLHLLSIAPGRNGPAAPKADGAG